MTFILFTVTIHACMVTPYMQVTKVGIAFKLPNVQFYQTVFRTFTGLRNSEEVQ